MNPVESVGEGSGLALLGFGSRLLAVPLSSLVTIEHSGKLTEGQESSPGAFATVEAAGQHTPVYAFTDDFAMCDGSRYPGHFCVVLRADDGARQYALACTDVEQLRTGGEYAGLQMIPDCMQLPGSPFAGLFMREGKLVLTADSSSLLGYIDRQCGQHE